MEIVCSSIMHSCLYIRTYADLKERSSELRPYFVRSQIEQKNTCTLSLALSQYLPNHLVENDDN